jgi:hypothetical protein
MFSIGRLVAFICLVSKVCLGQPTDLQTRWYFPASIDLLSVTIKDLQLLLSNGTITSVQLTQRYLVGQRLSRAYLRTT